MTNATEVIDRRKRINADAEDLPQTGVWMETNLPWKSEFWKKISTMRFMRLNPHWYIGKFKDGKYPIDDALVESEFNSDPLLVCKDDTFTATFEEVGLTLSARSTENGANTALSFDIKPPKGSPFTVEDAQRTMQYWLPSIREYYRLHQSNSLKRRVWRFFMDKVMLTMNPTQRRISAFIFKLTVLECLLILILGIGWFYYGA